MFLESRLRGNDSELLEVNGDSQSSVRTKVGLEKAGFRDGRKAERMSELERRAAAEASANREDR